MLILPELLAAVAAVVVGSVVLWANPQRRLNQIMFATSLHVTLWLLCRTIGPRSENGLAWLRVTVAIGAFTPIQLALLLDSILRPGDSLRSVARRLWPWLPICAAFAGIVFTDLFIPAESTPEKKLIGVGYIIHYVGVLGCYAVLVIRTLLSLKGCTGIERVELKVLLLGGASTALIILFLVVVRTLVPDFPAQVSVLVVFGEFLIVITAITTHRIFEARYLFLLAFQRVLLVLSVAGVIALANKALVVAIPGSLAFVFATAIGLFSAGELSRFLDLLLRRDSRGTDIRKKAFEIARRGGRVEYLEREFVELLKRWGQTDRAVILVQEEGKFAGGDVTLSENDPVMRTLRSLKWVTPERLVRERGGGGRTALADFLRAHRFAAFVYCEGPLLKLAVAVATRSTRRPFTYPQMQQLQELAAIVETAYARTFLTAKVQRAEQLASVGLMGAGIAHEIRNPLVSIKAFVQLLPSRHDDPVFRERFARIVGSEVHRIDRLTEQLLDLAAPRNYQLGPLALHPVLEGACELIKAKAEEIGASIECSLAARPDLILGDVDAVKQVVLNLAFNALQAQENRPSPRWIRLQTGVVAGGVELTVTDNGPGIPEAARANLFQPFHSTKSSGFGLGLAICADILSSLQSSISVDPPSPGQGAAFRVQFPCPPPSS